MLQLGYKCQSLAKNGVITLSKQKSNQLFSKQAVAYKPNMHRNLTKF